MKKSVCFFMVWCVLSYIVSAAYAEIRIEKLTDNGQSPWIDNGQVVWEGHDGHDYEIFFRDGQTVHQLTDNETDDRFPMIDNGQVVWNGFDGHDFEIFYWDGQTIHQLTDNEIDDAIALIDNGQVAWEGGDGHDYEVFFWDGQTVHQLTNKDTSNDILSWIDNGQVVWEGGDGHDNEVFYWDGQTVHQLTDNEIDDGCALIDNGQAVWEGDDGHDYEIFFWDGQTVHQLTDNETDDRFPFINNGQVTWEGDDGHDFEIFFWDGQAVHQLTDNEIDDGFALIDKGQAAWQGDDGRDNEVFFWDGQAVHQLTDNETDEDSFFFDNGQIVWEAYYDSKHSEIFYADTRAQSSDQVLLFDFGSGAIPTDDDPDNIWNNITEKVGCSNSGKLLDLVTANGETTQIDLVMQRRFNGSNPNGTWRSADFPSSATRDSLFGNTDTFNNLSNILPKFKLTGLDPQKTVAVTFYASRMNPKDNRETCYTVDGVNSGYTRLNPVNNVDGTARVSGIRPNAAGEITIRIAPAKKNTSNKHFTYLSVMKLEVTAN